MAKNNLQNIQIGTVDDFFSSEEERQNNDTINIKNIPLDLIDDFPNQPFMVRMDKEMAELSESIKDVGVLLPVLVRPKGNRYEMISGHRRKIGSELANLTDIPAVVRELNDDEAIIIMVDSNLQRETLLPSEKALAYKLRYDAMERRQGKRNDLLTTSAQDVSRLRTNEKLAKEVGESRETIRRYIKLTDLIPDILKMVDDGKIKITPTCEIASLTKEEQENLYQTMDIEDLLHLYLKQKKCTN